MRIFVGTYAKYNNGDLTGNWLDLEDYADLDDFYTACKELHKDEDNPELMFQDWMDIPDDVISESWLHKDVYLLVGLDEDDREIVCHYLSNVGTYSDLETVINDAQEAYVGSYDSFTDFAEEYIDDCLRVPDNPDNLANYISVEAVARDLSHDYTFIDGMVFRDI